MRFLTPTAVLLFLPASALAAVADGPDNVAAVAANERRYTVASQTMFTRYGTSHETMNVLSQESSIEVRIGAGLAFSLVVPLASSLMDNNACCGYSVGNLTGGARYRLKRKAMWVDLLASASAPTAPGDGDGGINSRYAATAAITRDAGFHLPGVTTVRLAVDAHVPIGERMWLGAQAGIHGWISHQASRSNQIVLPAWLSGGYRLSPRLFGFAAFTTIASPSQPQERFVHASEAGLGYAAERFTFSVRAHVPLDESLRDLGMVGVGANLQAPF